MSILPSFMQTQITERTQTANAIIIPKEYGIDFNTGQLTGRIVEGIEAIKVWVWLCLRTQRFRYPIYSWSYGTDMEQYIGQGLTIEYLETDLKDEIEEALRVNEYITGIENYSCIQTGSKVQIQFTVQTTLGSLKETYSLEV